MTIASLLLLIGLSGACAKRGDAQIEPLPQSVMSIAQVSRLRIPVEKVSDDLGGAVIGFSSSDGGQVWGLTRGRLLGSADSGKTLRPYGSVPRLPEDAVVKFFNGDSGLLLVEGAFTRRSWPDVKGFEFKAGVWNEIISLSSVSIRYMAKSSNSSGCFVGMKRLGVAPQQLSPVVFCFAGNRIVDLSAGLNQLLSSPPQEGRIRPVVPAAVVDENGCVTVLDSANQLHQKCGDERWETLGALGSGDVTGLIVSFTKSGNLVSTVETGGGVEGYGSRITYRDFKKGSYETIDLDSTSIDSLVTFDENGIVISGSMIDDVGNLSLIIGMSEDGGRSWIVDTESNKHQPLFLVEAEAQKFIFAYTKLGLYGIMLPSS
ncbi:MAG: hypothetical protein IPJ30_17080 [Acidobacteria bacterium]|nr:hypothetical protein [Acidobacteriota bacterium]